MLALLLLCGLTLAAETPLPPLPVTEELLARWEIPLERYRGLPEAEKRQLQADLSVGERTRLRRLWLIERLRPKDWRGMVNARGFLTPEGLALVSEHERRLADQGLAVPASVSFERKDGQPLTAEDMARAREVLDSVFDGTASLGPKNAPAGTELVFDARVRNGTLSSVTVTDPKRGLTFEAGQIGIDGRSPLLAPSPYLNLTKSWEGKPDSWVDYRVKAQVGYVDMRARFFAGGPDPRVERMIGLAERLGVGSEAVSSLRTHLTYDDAYKAQGLVVSSLLAQVGRAYNLYGPVDISWAATSLTKMVHLGPNQAFDESLGFRVRLPGEELFVGLFGGMTQNISPVGGRLYQELAATGTIQPGFNLENAPHWTAAVWGKMPGFDQTSFSVSAGQRYNRDTTTSQGEVALLSSFGRVPVAVRAQASREKGADIEFDRQKLRLQIEAQLSEQARGFVAAERERFRYGNAEVDSNAIYAGVSIDLGGRARVTVDQVFGSQSDGSSPLRPFLPDAAREVARTVAGGLEAAERAADLSVLLEQGAPAARIDAAMNALSLALSRLPPDASLALLDEFSRMPLSDDQRRWLSDALLRVVPPGSATDTRIREALSAAMGPAMTQWLARARDPLARAELLERMRADARDAAQLLRLLADADVWDATAVSAGRAALIRALSKGQKVNIPLLDKSITLPTNAPVLIAAMGAINSRLSPLAPLKREEAEPWLLRMAGDELGLPAGVVTSEQIAGRLIELGQARFQQELDRRLAPAVAQLLASPDYDPARAASTVMAALPPAAAEVLRQRYGSDLAGLLPPPGTPVEEVRRFLSQSLAAALSSSLGRELAGDLAQAIAQMSSWAAELVSREINLATIHLLLASEELDRLTVDRGRKASDLGVEMITGSFDRLDKRHRAKVSPRLRQARVEASARFVEDEKALSERLTALGRERLSAMQLDPSWPRGLTVVVPDASMAPLLAAYGDGAFFELVGRCAEKKRASKKSAPLRLTIEYDARPAFSGTSIYNEKDGGLRLVLSRPEDARAAAFRLSHLEDYLDK